MEKKTRSLTLALIFSGTLNVALTAALAFYAWNPGDQDLKISVPQKREAVVELTNKQIFQQISKGSFRELVSYLTNQEFIEEGYTKRDLALSALVAYHHFDLQRALGSKPSQVRLLSVPSGGNVEIFPNLSQLEFDAIIKFAYQEKWPLTSKGLYMLISKGNLDSTLIEAFRLSKEFSSLELLFQKTSSLQDFQSLLRLVVDGGWDLLQKVSIDLQQTLDFSIEKRRDVLAQYLHKKSCNAAKVWLTVDREYCLKRLDDKALFELIDQLKDFSEEGKGFCLSLLHSQRSDAVLHKAASMLYSYAGEILPAPFDLNVILSRFEGKVAPVKAVEKMQAVPVLKHHIVKDGETLWKISRIYKVSVDEIVKLNCLEKDALYPGMTLQIP
jgi:hypothetical protein